MDALLQRAGGHLSSIVVDRRHGVPTEWDARNGVVQRLAARHGLEVPLNRPAHHLDPAGRTAGCRRAHRGGVARQRRRPFAHVRALRVDGKGVVEGGSRPGSTACKRVDPAVDVVRSM
ncbi:MAG: ketopantoate reductase C-terminal domain-containing protein [Acidimicrobiales bacterium]